MPNEFNKSLRSTWPVPGTGPAAKGHRHGHDRSVMSWSSLHPKLLMLTEDSGVLGHVHPGLDRML